MHCLFCYKEVVGKVKVRIINWQDDGSNNDTSATENSELSKFFTFAGKHFGQRFDDGDEDLSLEPGENLAKLKERMKCCKDCLWNIRTFNECYHQHKNLELKLVSRMESIRDVMKFADKVPSRVKSFREALKMKEGKKHQVKLATISKFRQKVINYCSDLLKIPSEVKDQRNTKHQERCLTANATGQRLYPVAPNAWSQKRYQISALILPFLLLPQNPPPTKSSDESGDTKSVDISVSSSNASTQTECSHEFCVDPADAAQSTCSKHYSEISNDESGNYSHPKNETVSESVPEIESIVWTESFWSYANSDQAGNQEPYLSTNSLSCNENAKIVVPPTSPADCYIFQGNPLPAEPGPNEKLVHCPNCHTKFFPVTTCDLGEQSNRTESSSSTSAGSSSDSEIKWGSPKKRGDEYRPSDTEVYGNSGSNKFYSHGKRTTSRMKQRLSRNHSHRANHDGMRAKRSTSSSDSDCQIVASGNRNEPGVQIVTLRSSSSNGTSDTSINDDYGLTILPMAKRRRRILNYYKKRKLVQHKN